MLYRMLHFQKPHKSRDEQGKCACDYHVHVALMEDLHGTEKFGFENFMQLRAAIVTVPRTTRNNDTGSFLPADLVDLH